MAISKQAQKQLDFFIELEFGKAFSDPETFAAQVAEQAERQAKHEPYQLPHFVSERAAVREFSASDGTPVFVMEPKDGAKTEVTIVYYHGGGFLMDAEPVHFELVLNYMDTLGCTVALPIMPLVPSADCDAIITSALSTYLDLRAQYPANHVVLTGDSAGGNLCIAVSQVCNLQGHVQPDLVMPCSPFVDMTGITDEALGYPVKDDPIIYWYGTRELTELYRGDHDARSFPPDPLFGPMKDLAPMVVFCGTREILFSGVREFCRLVDEAGGQVEFKPYEGIWHAFLLNAKMGIPECDQAFEESLAAIRTYCNI